MMFFMVLKLCSQFICRNKVVVSVSIILISLGCWMAKNGSDHYFEHCPNCVSLCKLISQNLNKLLKYFCLHYVLIKKFCILD